MSTTGHGCEREKKAVDFHNFTNSNVETLNNGSKRGLKDLRELIMFIRRK